LHHLVSMSDLRTRSHSNSSWSTRRRLAALLALAAFGSFATPAHADAAVTDPGRVEGAETAGPPSSGTAADSAEPTLVGVGDARGALAGFVYTRVAAERPQGFAVRALAGYGLTESTGPVAGAHHRVGMSLGVSGQPLRWLGIGLALDGRYDLHPDDGAGRDRGFVTQSMLEVRATPTLDNGLSLGVAVAAFAYGNTAHAFDVGALTLESSALVSYGAPRFRVAGELGYRLDRSDAAAPGPLVMLRPGDRLALGMSSFDAVLVRLGGAVRLGPLDVYAEWTLDALLGSGNPGIAASPMHLALGARYPIGRTLLVDVFADTCLSQRPPLPNGGPYVRVDPRLFVGVALAYRYGGRSGRADPNGDLPDADGRPIDPDADRPPNDVRPDAPHGRTLTGTLLDASGAPLVDAHVVVEVDGERVEGYSDAEGRFVLEGIPDGVATVHVDAVGHLPRSETLGGGELALPGGAFRLESASAHGVLRGLVVGFDGEPVVATITVMPGHHTASSRAEGDRAVGQFELTLAPGRYSVRVESHGYATQTRDVTLTDGGVTILNVELRRDR
jgi:hypothetical protein